MKKGDMLIIAVSVLSVLVLINIIMNLQSSGIESVTGRAVGESGSSNEDYNNLVTEVSGLRSENERLILEKNDLSKKVEELEARIKVFEEEKELEKETCPLTCGTDELCSPVNKGDGSVEWQCVDNPERFV